MKTETAETKKARVVIRCECGRGYSVGHDESSHCCPACERDNSGSAPEATVEEKKALADKHYGTPSPIDVRKAILKRCGELSSVIFADRKVSDKVCMELHDMRWGNGPIGSELREQLWLIWESSRCSNHGLVVLALKMLSKQNPADLQD